MRRCNEKFRYHVLLLTIRESLQYSGTFCNDQVLLLAIQAKEVRLLDCRETATNSRTQHACRHTQPAEKTNQSSTARKFANYGIEVRRLCTCLDLKQSGMLGIPTLHYHTDAFERKCLATCYAALVCGVTDGNASNRRVCVSWQAFPSIAINR